MCKLLATELSKLEYVKIDVDSVEVNILFFSIDEKIDFDTIEF